MPLSLDRLPLVSADSHVDEPGELWSERLPARLRDRGPRQVRDEEGRKRLLMPGLPQQAKRELPPVPDAHCDAEQRLRDLDRDGIAGEVIFPGAALYLWHMRDAELGEACCRVYNEWIAAELARASERFCCPALIPAWRIEGALEALRHGHALGLRAAMLPMVATPMYNDRSWEPFWQACEELAMPVTAHQGTGHDMLHYRGPGAAGVNYMTTQSFAARSAGLLANSGVLERHPTLHFAMVECAGGWLAWLMQALDEAAVAHANWQYPVLAHPPSFYLRRQLHVTFQQDPVAVHNRSLTGIEPLLWGSDYPHHEGTFPESRAAVARLFAGVPLAEAEAIVGGNCARVFGLERVRERALAAALGA